MAAVDLALTFACLLLWLNWWSKGFGSARSAGIALVSTLRRAEPPPPDRWKSPALIFTILFLRSVVYWAAGPSVVWVPKLPLGAVVLHFRHDVFLRTLAFSFLSFVVYLGAFVFCLLLLSAVNQNKPSDDPWQGVVRGWLGPLERLPRWLKLLLPGAVGFCFWLCLAPLLAAIGVHAKPSSAAHLLEEAALIGIVSWLPWRFAMAVVLGLHIVTTYVYLGNAPFWRYISTTAKTFLRCMAFLPLRVGRLDFAPAFMLIGAFAIVEIVRYWLPPLFGRLPL